MTQNSEIVEIRQKEAECELEAARDRVQQQATEILLKASKTLNFFSSLILTCFYNASKYLHPRYSQDTSWACHANTSNMNEQILSSRRGHRGLQHFNGEMLYIQAKGIPSPPEAEENLLTSMMPSFKCCVYVLSCGVNCCMLESDLMSCEVSQSVLCETTLH